ncbi:uncharacterized protein EAE97_004886 [Botrytis byssoidea]|uniref:Uncharacterized protein n=1 Tax=Botrytis byssoidea TaxID=139641 RepID=A0A9P5M652_9HELO|nr:uncharacterized protein EAE97_004886 [Botrytis byssoidea]KAF7945848.1 hypothetical protein EAE97_004886 [Botrytis byssoidea]
MSNFQLLTKPTPLSGEAHRKSPSLSFTPSLAPSSSTSKSTSKSKSTSSSPSSSSSSALRPTFRPLYKTLSLSYRYPSSTSNPSSTNGTPNTSTTFTILLSIYKYIDLLARRLAFEFALFMLGGGFNLMLLLLWPGWIPVLGVVGGVWWVWG